ncbi:response regulator [Sphingomonas metalli]|uniref:Response regulator n=1 Tax=Sphingomonas metalli TaxID=1779358 RepID=A0A916WUS1_9SPHN|nr:response regulator [Sphingomonas metalli]GGB35744.1 response regulator [Sphingomonas metalli]
MLFGRKKRNIERLLVVEDEPLVAFENEHVLSDAGYVVVATVDRVADALSVLGEDQVDLVVVDVNLADGSGLDVARAARGQGVPVLFVTGAFPPEATPLAAGVLAKPYAQRDLVGAIDAVEAGIAGKTPRRLPPGFQLFQSAA